MSIQSQINRISGNISESLTAVANKGVTVPSGSNSDNLPDLIELIAVDSTYSVTKNLTDISSSADDTKVIAGNSFFTRLAPIPNNYVISSITVTMGGVDVTSQVFTPDEGGGGGSSLGTKNITQNGTYNAVSDGYDGYSQVTVNVQGGITPTGTKSISISTNGTTTEDVTNYASAEITVNVPTGTARSSSDLTVSGATVTAPAGLYASAASKTVASGTEGTPTATKGTVSNHSVTVTPSVTNTAGYIPGGTKTGTGVTVSASELVSGNLPITQNGTNIDVANYATVSVSVEGGGGSGMTVATATATPSSASSSISFTGLSGEPTSFAVISTSDLATGASPYKTAAVVFDGTNVIGQRITNTSNANANYDGTGFSKTYSNGTLTITGTGTNFQANQYSLVYTYGGNSANIATEDVQVGSGATSITFTGLSDEPSYFSCIFKSDFGTSSGYQRVIAVVYDGTSTYGMELDSSAHYSSAHWSYTYNNGSLTISSQGTNAGGYFHQPGNYQLTYGIGGEINIEIEPLTVTQNGTYSESGKAYSPVVVNVPSSGGANFATETMTNSSNQATSIEFTLPSGRTPKAFFARLTSQIARNSSSRYYYVFDMRWDGSSTGGVAGNTFYMYNGTLSNVTSGYSYSQDGTAFTLTTTGSRSASPGSFFNGTYELVYVY